MKNRNRCSGAAVKRRLNQLICASQKRSCAFALAAALFFPLAARAQKLNVVATTPDLAAIAREIGGERVEVKSLAKPMEDPHFVQAKPGFIVALNKADALIEGGADLESGWLTALLDGTRNRNLAAGAAGRIVIAPHIEMLERPRQLDRSQGDVHAWGNPHFLTDPENAKIAGREICEAFCKLDAVSAVVFRENLAKFSERLDTKLAEWRKTLAPFRGARIAAYHNTWPYFARRFELNIDLFLEPKPGIPPSPAHLANVVKTMKADNVRAVIVEPFQNRKTAEFVAAQTNAQVVEFAQYPGGVKGTEGGYIQLMDHLVGALAKALGGK
jgi:zinc/manganese transport system substrate-binding protein